AIARHAATCPNSLAIVENDRSVNYGGLETAANRLAHVLRRRGLKREQRVAVDLPRGIEAVIAMLAVLKAGGAYVPLDFEDPPARRSAILTAVEACLCLTTTARGTHPADGSTGKIVLEQLDLA